MLALAVGVVETSADARGDQGAAALEQTTSEGVSIDWHDGTLTAAGGAAADFRMPSVDLARPGAERRARAAALRKLRTALADLPLGGGRKLEAASIDRALERARAVDVQYQSNGGAVVRLEVAFGDWLDRGDRAAAAPSVAFTVAEARLAAAPEIEAGGRVAVLGGAVYRVGTSGAPALAQPARFDARGRLVVGGGADAARKLAQSLAVIYVRKLLP
jgi:hypothetical protein